MGETGGGTEGTGGTGEPGEPGRGAGTGTGGGAGIESGVGTGTWGGFLYYFKQPGEGLEVDNCGAYYQGLEEEQQQRGIGGRCKLRGGGSRAGARQRDEYNSKSVFWLWPRS